MKQTIYVVGRPFNRGQIVEELHNLGYEVGVFVDKNFHSKLLHLYDSVIALDFGRVDGLADQLKDHHDIAIDGVVCTFENYLLARTEIAEFYQLLAPSKIAAAACTDKLLMRQAFTAYDPSLSPEFSLIDSLSAALAFAGVHGFPVMIKPTNLVKSLLVMRCDTEAELRANYELAVSTIQELYDKYRIYDRQPKLIIEQYITGRSCSVAAFVDTAGEPHFCAGITAITTAADRGIDDSYLYSRQLPGDYNQELQDQIFAVARSGVKALGMTSTAAHIELIHNGGDAKIVEIGARIGGYRQLMYDYVYGVDLLAAEAKLATGQMTEQTPTRDNYCAVFELFPSRVGTFGQLDGDIDHLLADAENVSLRVRALPGQLIGPAKAGYKAAAVITVHHDDKQQFIDLCKLVDNLSVAVVA
jgi:hypothetical protein